MQENPSAAESGNLQHSPDPLASAEEAGWPPRSRPFGQRASALRVSPLMFPHSKISSDAADDCSSLKLTFYFYFSIGYLINLQ